MPRCTCLYSMQSRSEYTDSNLFSMVALRLSAVSACVPALLNVEVCGGLVSVWCLPLWGSLTFSVVVVFDIELAATAEVVGSRSAEA